MASKALFTDISGSFLLRVVNAGLLLLVSIVLARWLSPAAYGNYAFVMSCIGLAMVPVQFGMPTLLIREIARHAQLGNWARVRGAIRAGWLGVCILSLIIGCALAAYFHFDTGIDSSRRYALLLAVPLIPLIGLNRIRYAILQGFQRIVSGQIPDFVVAPLGLLVAVLFARNHLAPTAASALALRVGATFLALIVGLVLIRSGRPAAVVRERPAYFPRQWIKAVLPFSLLAALGAANSQIDIFLLGLLAPANQVGLYKVAAAAAGMIVFAQAAFSTAMEPRFAALHAAADHAALERLARTSTRWVLVATLPGAAVLIFAGRFLLSLIYGTDYAVAAMPMAVLCLGQIVNGAVGSVALLLNMTGFEKYTLRMSVLMLIITVLLMLALVPWAGVMGAAIASALATTIWNLLLLHQVKLRLDINPAIFGKPRQHMSRGP